MNRILLFLLLFCVNTDVNTQNYTVDTISGATWCENCDEID
mgnify:FL=1